jgi:hypothetical protein
LTQGGGCGRPDEGKQHELGETHLLMLPGPLLQGHEGEQVSCAVGRVFKMASHQRGGARQPGRMHFADHGTPLAGREFLRAEAAPDPLAEHLGGRARNRTKAGLLQGCDHLRKGEPVLLRDEQQLLGREGMQMQPWGRITAGRQQPNVVMKGRALEPRLRVQAALQAKLRGPEGLGLRCSVLEEL